MLRIVFYIVVFAVMLPVVATAQKQDKSKQPQIDLWKSVSDRALKYRDLETYKTANTVLVELDPAKDTVYQKNIMSVLFQTGRYESCYLLSKDLITKYSKDTTILEYYARSAEQLKILPEALTGYEKLYELTHNCGYGYFKAFTQYMMGRFPEALQTIEYLKLDPNTKTQFIDFAPIGASDRQIVSLYAALFNLQGMAHYELKNFEVCKEAFGKAVELEPTFKVAADNLEKLK